MKKIHLILLALITSITTSNSSVAAECNVDNGEPADKVSAQCYEKAQSVFNEICTNKILKNPQIKDPTSDYSVSKGLAECIKYGGDDFIKLDISQLQANDNWKERGAKIECRDLCREAKTAFGVLGKTSEPKILKTFILNFEDGGDIDKCINNEKFGVIKGRCISAAYILKSYNRSFANSNQNGAKKDNNSGQQNSGVVTTSQTGISVQQNESLSCVTAGVETIDYEPCKGFNEYNQNLEVASQAVKTGQNLYYQNKAIDTAYDVTKNSANDATAALKAQKSSFKDQQEYYTTSSAMEATKFGVLISKYKDMPDLDDLKAKCSDSQIASYKTECGYVVSNPEEFKFLMNEGQKEKMKKRLAQLGISTVSEGANAYMAGQRANQLSDAIANVDNFKPVTSAGLEEAVNATYCQMNPSAAKCKSNLNSQFSTIGDNIVDFGSNGTGTVYSGSTDTTSDGSSTTNSNGSSSTTSKTGVIGSAITGVDKGSGIIGGATAATISKGNAPAGGGGGGGGAAGGVGGGGGGASGSAAGAQAAVAGSSGKIPTYSGGVNVMGGMGIKSGAKKSSDNSNPFANLMNKDKVANDKVLNFNGRGPASVGTKGDNLFDMISKRYGNVNNEKRLLEYEDVK